MLVRYHSFSPLANDRFCGMPTFSPAKKDFMLLHFAIIVRCHYRTENIRDKAEGPLAQIVSATPKNIHE